MFLRALAPARKIVIIQNNPNKLNILYWPYNGHESSLVLNKWCVLHYMGCYQVWGVIMILPYRFHDIALVFNTTARRRTVLKYNQWLITIESLFIYIYMCLFSITHGYVILQVALRNKKSRSVRCAGSLIAPQLVLTTAHCVDEYVYKLNLVQIAKFIHKYKSYHLNTLHYFMVCHGHV